MIDDIQPSFRFFVTLLLPDPFVPEQLLTGAMQRPSAAFQTATGLGGELEVTSYPEGGLNDTVHQLPLRHSWSRITLTKGIARDPVLWAWYAAGLYGSLGARQNGAIIMQNAKGVAAMVWTFRAGLAAKWTGPEFNAEQDGLAIEKLEIAHEGISYFPGPGLSER